MKIDSSAVKWSAPERERAGRPLLVLLHGYASHEGDLFGLSPLLPLMPVIASVRGPIAENGGWAWYSRTKHPSADPVSVGANAAVEALLSWLGTLEYTDVSVLGFSQGATVALQLLRTVPELPTATVALSGFVAEGPQPRDAELELLAPPVFYGRGTLDRVIPPDDVARTEAWLPLHASATVRIYEELAHGISTAELGEVSRFLRSPRP